MIVIKYFIDKTDKSEYNPGDQYPRDGLKADEFRIADLTAKGYISENPVEKPEEAKTPERPVDQVKKPAKNSKSRKKKEQNQ